jgi:hypothetical protein
LNHVSHPQNSSNQNGTIGGDADGVTEKSSCFDKFGIILYLQIISYPPKVGIIMAGAADKGFQH